MKNTMKRIAVAVVIILSAANFLKAQSYILVPGNSIDTTADFEVNGIYNILPVNNTSDSLWLSWEKVSAYLPDLWTALICDNRLCYGDLKQNGDMLPVVVGDKGLMSIHATAHTNPGTAIIRYALWVTNNPSERDTLTWTINAGLTGITNTQQNQSDFFLSDHQLIVQNSSSQNQTLRIFDLQGRVLLERKITSGIGSLDLSNLPASVLLVELQGENSKVIHKIFLQ